MDIENIIYNQDSGSEAIKKLDRNQRKIATELGTSQQQINVLNSDRGYLTSKIAIDFNSIMDNGKYSITNGTNTPDGSTASVWLLEVTSRDVSACYQKAICLYSELGNTGKIYERTRGSSIWQPWKEISTTSTWKPTSSNLANGWQAWGGIYPTFVRNGNLVTVTNGNIGGGTITAGTILLTGIPAEYIPSTLRTGVLKHSTGVNAMSIVDVDGTIKVDTSWGGSWLSIGLYDMNFSYHLV